MSALHDPHKAGMGWQDIASAPKDGTPVLIAQKNKHGWYIDAGENFFKIDGVDVWRPRESNDLVVAFAPSHWMPLPPPPEAA